MPRNWSHFTVSRICVDVMAGAVATQVASSMYSSSIQYSRVNLSSTKNSFHSKIPQHTQLSPYHDSDEEALSNIREAVELYLETLSE
jgi:predicted RNase H-like HicB family nuclease